jgi:hypothetical protein
MTRHRPAITKGLGALGKSALVILGVPFAIVRLWYLAPALPSRIDLSSARSAGGVTHLLLLLVGVLWVWVAITLVREIVTAVRSPDPEGGGAWPRRWAGAIAGLLLLFGASSTVAATLPGRSGPIAVVRPYHGTLHDAPPMPQRAPGSAARDGECLADFAERLTGERGAWPDVARRNLGTAQIGGTRFVDANLLRPGWCLEVPPDLDTSASPTISAGASGSTTGALVELSLLAVGVLTTGALARRLVALRRLAESERRPGARLPAPEPEDAWTIAAIRPFGDSLLVDWVDAALRVASGAPSSGHRDASFPDVRLVRAGPEGVELLLGAALPDPPPPLHARDGGRWWVLDAADLDAPETLAPQARRVAPWVLPIGEDDDAVYLLGIGPRRHLVIDGDDVTQRAALRATFAALRVLPWTDELAVELIGMDPPPPEERCFGLFASSPATLASLAGRGPLPARSHLPEEWRREPLVLVAPESDDLPPELLTGVNRCAGVISCAGEGTEHLEIASDGAARLWPYGIWLRTPLPSAEQSDLIDRLFAAASATVSLLPPPIAPSARPDIPPPPQGPRSAGTDATDHPTGAPVEVTLLDGVPRLSGFVQEPSPRERDRVVELLVYLVLHGGRSDVADARRALFPREDARRSTVLFDNLLAVARRTLPSNGDGWPLLGHPDGRVLHLRDGVGSDWARVRRAIDLARTGDPRDALSVLSGAIECVRAPWLLDDRTNYPWCAAEGISAGMRAEIIDAIHDCATFALAVDAVDLARRAIDTGLVIDPLSEILVRDAIVVCERTGDHAAAHAYYRSLESALERLASAEPSNETRALLRFLVEP